MFSIPGYDKNSVNTALRVVLNMAKTMAVILLILVLSRFIIAYTLGRAYKITKKYGVAVVV